MADVFITMTREDLAAQIAGLLNQHNKLTKIHDVFSILSNANTTYFVEIVRDRVVGCIGIEELNKNTSKIKHLCVHQNYRNQGIGKKLIDIAIKYNKNKTKDFVMYVRADNTSSFILASLFGFIHTNTDVLKDRTILTLRRRIE